MYVLHCMQDEWLRRFPLVDRFLRVLEQVPEQSGPRTRKIVYKTVHLKLEGVVRAFPVQGWCCAACLLNLDLCLLRVMLVL